MSKWLMRGHFWHYTSIAFQQYKERFNARCFDPYNQTLKFRESRWTPKPPISRMWVSSSHSSKSGVVTSSCRPTTNPLLIWLVMYRRFRTWFEIDPMYKSLRNIVPIPTIASPSRCTKDHWVVALMASLPLSLWKDCMLLDSSEPTSTINQ